MSTNETIRDSICSIDYEAECERKSRIIERQKEIILALKKACFGMADALVNEEEI